MFYSFFAVGMLLVGNVAYAADGELRVKGKLKNFGDTAIVFVNAPGSRDTKPDTFLVKNDKFDFTVKVNKISDMTIVTPQTMRETENKFVRLIAVPGETLELNGDMDTRYDMAGSAFYKKYNEVGLMLEEAGKEIKAFNTSLQSRLKAGESRDVLMKEFNEKILAMGQRMVRTMMDFIKQQPNNEACVVIINQFEALEQMEEAVGYLSPGVREGRMKPYYSYFITKLRARKEADERAAKKQVPGIVAPDFTLNDINGKPLTLSSLRGKYVLLDFWGAWCGWCIKGFPDMKAYYEKYKDKMEILGIDCNDTEAKWKAAVQEHQLPWLHVYNPRNSSLTSDYGVRGFPTKIILDPEGKIVKAVAGEDPAFYTFLDELFGK